MIEDKAVSATPPSDAASDREDGSAENITFVHGGKFAEYIIYGNVFQLTSKYRPPLNPIGRGAYGIVCSAFNKETNQGVAIKKIANAFDNKTDAKRTLREIQLLRYLKHENIVAIKDIIPPPKKKDFNDVYIVYELMDTDLQQVMKLRQSLTEDHCKYFLYQILRGLKYIHSTKVLHRDLKPSNLLINSNCDLKICDFGMARLATPDEDFMTEYVVTRWYRPPELLLNTNDYTTAVDMWSLGCIYMELLTGRPLFPGRDYAHQLRCILEVNGTPKDSEMDFVKSENARRYIKNLPKTERKPLDATFPDISPLAIDLIQKMLSFDPAQRITAMEALDHPYLSSLHDESDEPCCTRPFSLDYDEESITVDHIKDLVYKEALRMNPKFTK